MAATTKKTGSRAGGKIKDMLGSEETLFRDEDVFLPDHMPDQFSFRDDQVKELGHALKPGLRGARPFNAFIIGPPATGKTTAVRIVFDQLKQATSKVIPVYVNCHMQASAFRIFSEIRRAVVGMPAPDTGVPITKVQDEVFARLARDKKVLVVGLDEADYLLASNAASDVLYSILRAHESYESVHTAVFAVSAGEFLHHLEDRVRSTFSPVRVEFSPYGADETFHILKARRDAGLYPGVLSDALLRKTAGRIQDLRFGIELMRQATLAAESEAVRRVTDRHMEKVMGIMEPPEASGDKMIILSILREKGGLESGQLFELAKKQRSMGYTTFYRMLQQLKAARLVEIKPVSKLKGKTSLIRAV